jgi:(p)ppGpp synthase/HD superfamily hydrolase
MNKIAKAFEIAHKAHKNQKRKGSGAPFIVHPMEVSINLMKEKASENQILAALLHDTVEDTNITLKDIKKEFGNKIAIIVDALTEPEELRKNNAETWKERKEHTIQFMKTSSKEIKLISCADKLANVRSSIEDQKNYGEKIWLRFKGGKKAQKWYMTEMLKSFKQGESIETTNIYQQLKKSVNKLFL